MLFAIDGVTEGVHDTAKELRADRDVDNLAGTLDSVALLDGTVITEDRDTDVVGLQVQAHAADARGEFNHLLGCRRVYNQCAGNVWITIATYPARS